MFRLGVRSFARAIPATALAALVAAILASSAGAAEPCPDQYDFCTDPSGEYVLTVPPLSEAPFPYSEFASCTWEVHVDFGDGTSGDYSFDGSVGLVGSHVFPTPGVTYTVVVYPEDGVSSEPGVFCPEVPIVSTVRYRTPEEEAEAPPDPGGEGPGGEGEGGEEGEGQDGWEAIDQGGTVPDAILVRPVQSTPNAFVAPAPPTSRTATHRRSAFWRNCRKGIRAHRVGCRRARRVARRAGRRLGRRSRTRVAGFRCRRARGAARRIVCRRGVRRILARA